MSPREGFGPMNGGFRAVSENSSRKLSTREVSERPSNPPQPSTGAADGLLCLGRQLRLVLDVMVDGRWRTLFEIAAATKAPQSSVSARLRDLRKARFGGHTIERRRRTAGAGTWEYCLVVIESEARPS
jgi:hypothetical protein